MINKDATEDVLMAYCHNGNVANCFMLSVLNAFQYDLNVGYGEPARRRLSDFHHAQGPYIYDGRSKMVEDFLENPERKHLQWLWFVDNDMDFPADTLHRLLATAEENDKKFVAAAYWNQYSPHKTFLSWLVLTPDSGVRPVASTRNLPSQAFSEGGLLQVNAVGMGCTLIHRSVLQDVADMYPNDPWATFGADILVEFEDGGYAVGRTPEELQAQVGDRAVRKFSRMGEDVTFSIRATRCGYPPHGIPWIEVDHFKPHVMSPGDQSRESSPGDVSLSPRNP